MYMLGEAVKSLRRINMSVFDFIEAEKQRQINTVELIASENFVSEDVMRAMGSCLTNKYAEGKPYHRYYGGCQIIDDLEAYCQSLWKIVFNTDYHVNVQPHSGTNANLAAYTAFLKPGDKFLAMDLNEGGHLSHGSKVNASGKLYQPYFYHLGSDNLINYSTLRDLALEVKPKLILAGASAYPRIIDFQKIYEVCQEVGAIFMVDMAHIAGLIAAGDHPSPFDLADVITTTTHKTLRGPRGGMIFCKPEYAKKIDSAVFPGTQGGPLEHVIAAKAVCAEEALRPEFKSYIHQVIKNSKAMAQEFVNMGYDVITGGTDNHLFLIDLSRTHPQVSGKMVQDGLDLYGITLNKNCIPGEQRSPMEASGLRIGTAAMTTRGYTEMNFIGIAHRIDSVIQKLVETEKYSKVQLEVKNSDVL